MYNFGNLKTKIKEKEEWLQKELSGIRTGRANLAVLDSIKVEAYGAEMPVNQVANVSVEDARTIRVTPWDATLTKAIEKAVIVSNTGLSVAVDDKGLRLTVPMLTTETRGQYVKLAKQKVEDGKIALRQERGKTNDDIQNQKKDGAMSEDDMAKAKVELDKIIKEASTAFDALGEKKEAEIMS